MAVKVLKNKKYIANFRDIISKNKKWYEKWLEANKNSQIVVFPECLFVGPIFGVVMDKWRQMIVLFTESWKPIALRLKSGFKFQSANLKSKKIILYKIFYT